MPLQAVEPQRLYRQIAEQLRQLIARGEFALGSRLPAERDLATQLGVSRPSVREALIALEVEGVIEVRTGSGIYVKAWPGPTPAASGNGPTEWGPLEVMRARLLVEPEVAALAAEHDARMALLESIGIRPGAPIEVADVSRQPLPIQRSFTSKPPTPCTTSTLTLRSTAMKPPCHWWASKPPTPLPTSFASCMPSMALTTMSWVW